MRSNNLIPQPVSGVSSRNIRERMALAQREAQRLLALSCRCTRQPANSLMSGAAASRAASNFGRSAGSFWPSPSRVATQSARAASTPVRIAVLCPLCVAWPSTRSSGTSRLSETSACRLPSLERSSTYTISNGILPRRTATTSPTSGATFASSLNTGTTTESRGRARELTSVIGSGSLVANSLLSGHWSMDATSGSMFRPATPQFRCHKKC